MPSCTPVNDECLSYQQRFAVKDMSMDCSRELKLKTVEFTPAQYLKLKRTLEQMEYDQRKAIRDGLRFGRRRGCGLDDGLCLRACGSDGCDAGGKS